MTPVNIMLLLTTIVVSSLILLIIGTLAGRRLRSRSLPSPPIIAFACAPSDDEEITCIFCGLSFVDLEYSYRTWNRMVTAGVHSECLVNPRYKALSERRMRVILGI